MKLTSINHLAWRSHKDIKSSVLFFFSVCDHPPLDHAMLLSRWVLDTVVLLKSPCSLTEKRKVGDAHFHYQPCEKNKLIQICKAGRKTRLIVNGIFRREKYFGTFFWLFELFTYVMNRSSVDWHKKKLKEQDYIKRRFVQSPFKCSQTLKIITRCSLQEWL